jgi:hypothetical protein
VKKELKTILVAVAVGCVFVFLLYGIYAEKRDVKIEREAFKADCIARGNKLTVEFKGEVSCTSQKRAE